MSTMITWICPISNHQSKLIKVPGKFKHELGSRIIEEFIALSPKTYSLVTHGQSPFRDYPNKTEDKGIKNCNNAKHEEYYNALMYNTQRTR